MKRYEIIGEPTFELMEFEDGNLILYDDFSNLISAEIDRLKDYANATDNYDRAEFTINILKKLL